MLETPAPLAARMAAIAGIDAGWRVAEPSAGTGSLVRAALDRGASYVRAWEIDPSAAAVLRGVGCGATRRGLDVVEADFLAALADYDAFDAVLMHPPAAHAITHVRHAFDLLAPGGVLVAVMSERVFSNRKAKYAEFRTWLDTLSGDGERLPADTFATVAARLVTIQAPGA
jgi:predicted RNA methylase